MTFERILFEKVREVFPNTTARTFSSDCGKSVGYYGSITAQELPISTNALIHLAEILEYRGTLLTDLSPQRKQRIVAVQQMIADEIAARAQNFDSDSFKVRTMILNALARTTKTRDSFYWIPPVIVG